MGKIIFIAEGLDVDGNPIRAEVSRDPSDEGFLDFVEFAIAAKPNMPIDDDFLEWRPCTSQESLEEYLEDQMQRIGRDAEAWLGKRSHSNHNMHEPPLGMKNARRMAINPHARDKKIAVLHAQAIERIEAAKAQRAADDEAAAKGAG